MSAQAGNITEVYTNAGSTAYVSGAAVGSLLYVNMPLAFVQECPVGKVLVLMDNIYPWRSIAMRVQARTENGASASSPARCFRLTRVAGQQLPTLL